MFDKIVKLCEEKQYFRVGFGREIRVWKMYYFKMEEVIAYGQ